MKDVIELFTKDLHLDNYVCHGLLTVRHNYSNQRNKETIDTFVEEERNDKYNNN